MVANDRNWTIGAIMVCVPGMCIMLLHFKITIDMHVCMRKKQLEWCTHCRQEVPKTGVHPFLV